MPILPRAALAVILLVSPALAETRVCALPLDPGPAAFRLDSASADRRYGVLVAVPDDLPCPVVRFRVQLAGDRILGQSPPLRPGERAVVRMGQGFAPGAHALVIATAGCPVVPAEVRRVTLAKASPDHGWRWRAAPALLPMPD